MYRKYCVLRWNRLIQWLNTLASRTNDINLPFLRQWWNSRLHPKIPHLCTLILLCTVLNFIRPSSKIPTPRAIVNGYIPLKSWFKSKSRPIVPAHSLWSSTPVTLCSQWGLLILTEGIMFLLSITLFIFFLSFHTQPRIYSKHLNALILPYTLHVSLNSTCPAKLHPHLNPSMCPFHTFTWSTEFCQRGGKMTEPWWLDLLQIPDTVLKQGLTIDNTASLSWLNLFSTLSGNYFVHRSPQVSPSLSTYLILSANNLTMDLIGKLYQSRWELSHLFTVSTGGAFSEKIALTNILDNWFHLSSGFYPQDVLSRASFLKSPSSLLHQFLPLYWILTKSQTYPDCISPQGISNLVAQCKSLDSFLFIICNM